VMAATIPLREYRFVTGSGGMPMVTERLTGMSSTMSVVILSMTEKYSRLGPSIYVHGPDVLIDTPEEISLQINRSTIKDIKACLYSHWHPDHTAGRRIFEMNIDWIGLPPQNKTTKIVLPEKIASTFENAMSIMEHFKFMKSQGIIDLQIVKNDEKFVVNNFIIEPIQLSMDYVFGYIISNDTQKILIVMDELKNWVPSAEIQNTAFDLIYLPFGIFDVNPFTNKRNIDVDHPLLAGEQTIEETLGIVTLVKAKKFILSHIEEPDNITIGFAKKLEAHYSAKMGKNIELAYDTMLIDV